MILMHALNTNSWKEKGITPVIAIVLLVMMTVGAAVGTWTFIQQVQSDVQDDVTQQTGTSLEVRGTITCDVSTEIKATVENTGTTDFDGESVNVFVYDTQGKVVTSGSDLSLSGSWTSANGVGDITISDGAGSGNTIDLSQLSDGSYYNIELRFTRKDWKWSMGRCQAES